MSPAPWTATVALRRGRMEMQMVPGLGACVAGLLYCAPDRAPVHLLRPLPEDSQDLFLSGGHVMVPFANRLHGQRLLDGPGTEQARPIACNRPGIGDPVHGVGWMKAWALTGQSSDALTLSCTHVADDHWPWTHACTLQVRLEDNGVVFRLAVRNQHDAPMPVGMGFHPYLSIDPDSRLFFTAASRWEQDADGLPTHMASVPPLPADGAAAQRIELNHCFSAWRGPVRLLRPAHGLVLELRADADLPHLQIYRRAGVPWLCAEPMSHATGAWSLPQVHHADAGLRWLAPGAEWETGMEVRVVPLVA